MSEYRIEGGFSNTMSNIHGVFRAALNGIHERGNGGFVFVKGDECAYMFPHEIAAKNKDMASTLEEMLSDEKAQRVFYVVEERDSALHVLAYPRDTVLKDMLGASQGSGM